MNRKPQTFMTIYDDGLANGEIIVGIYGKSQKLDFHPQIKFKSCPSVELGGYSLVIGGDGPVNYIIRVTTLI